MAEITTDYLVIGAGTGGLAFTDTLLGRSDHEVVIADRRSSPGGHWNDAYPFVQLHQPSAFYGVESRSLGDDRIDTEGVNAGYYERATAAQVVDYYQRLMDETFVGSGRVRFLDMHDWVPGDGGSHRLTSRLTGEVTTVTPRHKVVDATQLEQPIPKTHIPPFVVDDGAICIPVNDLALVGDSPGRFTVLGSGKTAMDSVVWLLDHGVDPGSVRWVRPRDAWMFDRAGIQPLEGLPSLLGSQAAAVRAAAEASDLTDLFHRLEDSGGLMRVDPEVEPTMWRCAVLSRIELEQLRRVTDVVRLGRVRRIGTSMVELEHGSVPAAPGELFVDCTSDIGHLRMDRTVFAGDTITLQPVRTCQPSFNSALAAFVECTRDGDEEKNRVCRPNPYPVTTRDWLAGMLAGNRQLVDFNAAPDLAEWIDGTRLNFARGLAGRMAEPGIAAALDGILAHTEASDRNLERLLATPA